MEWNEIQIYKVNLFGYANLYGKKYLPKIQAFAKFEHPKR